MQAFKRVVYDYWKKKIWLWDCGSSRPRQIDYRPGVYVRDDSIQNPEIKDIYGNPVRPASERERAMLEEWGIKRKTDRNAKCPISGLCEQDLDPATLFLQDRYRDADLQPDSSLFKIAFLDIEVAGGNGGKLPDERLVARKIGTETRLDITIAELEKKDVGEYEVWQNGEWVSYRNSIYAISDFPEAKKAKYPINLITVSDSQTGETTTFGIGEYTGNSPTVQNYKGYRTEAAMMTDFMRWFSEQDFDILSGWNVVNFDLQYIYYRLFNNSFDGSAGLLQLLSPLRKLKIRDGKLEIAGLLVLDYYELYKKFTYVTEPSYKLQDIGMKVCGEGKVEYEGSISSFYKKDWNKFVEYNVQDVRLVEKIDKKKRFIELAITFAYQALIPIDKVFSSVATIEGYILRHLHQHKMVMPNNKKDVRDWWVEEGMYNASVKKDPSNPNSETIQVVQNFDKDEKEREEFYVKGGHVASNPGFYTSSLCFDVASLYPHMIIQYNISPETKRTIHDACDKSGLIESEINGVWYTRERGILPTIVKRLFDERSMFKKKMFKEEHGSDAYNYFNSMQMVRKILINSMYGVMIRPGFHFYDVDLARSITRGGRVLIRFLSAKAEKAARMLAEHPERLFPGAKPFELKNKVLSLIDTDSNHLHFQELKEHLAPEMDEKEFLKKMETYMEAAFEAVLKKKANVKGMEQVINFKREGVITRELVLAKKKYISLLVQNEDEIYDPPYMKVTGVEITRSDTPTYCRSKLTEVVKMIMEGADETKVNGRIAEIYSEFKSTDINEIASVGSVSDCDKYKAKLGRPDIFGIRKLEFDVATPMRNKAAIAYNHFVIVNKLPLERVSSGSKIKYIHIKDDGTFQNDVIAWIGSCPAEIRKRMKVDYDKQFETFINVINRIFEVLGWTKWTPSMLSISKFFS